MDLDDGYKVLGFRTLKKPRKEEALRMLEKIAKQVQPIMRKHKWRINLLSEFCNNKLLGQNWGKGKEVKLRLRGYYGDWDFLPYEEVLDTMLHEFCHNVISPHDASFYKLWDELRQECAELMAKGVTGAGEGFDLPGRRLGGFSIQPPLSSLRQTALGAVEKRLSLGSLLPSGPKRLGGDITLMGALSPIQAAAMAAERRLQDELWCGSQSLGAFDERKSSSDLLQEFQPKGYSAESSKASINAEKLVSDAVPPKKSRLADSHSGSTPKRRQKPIFIDLTDEATSAGSFLNNREFSRVEDQETFWECSTCTLLNPPVSPFCDACGDLKPKDVETKFKSWSCKFCTLDNSVELDKCTACEQWR